MRWRLKPYTSYTCKNHLIYISQIGPMDELHLQLAKLTELAPVPLDLSFLLGYLACALPQHLAGGVRPMLRQLLGHIEERLITAENVLQLLTVLKITVLPKRVESISRLVAEMEAMTGQLICDNSFLDYRYFSKRIVELKQEDNIGLGIDCTICTVEIEAKEVCCLSCSHMYHRSCLEGFCRERIASKAFPLRCPTQECGIELLIEEVNEYLSRQLRQKYDQFVFHNYVEKHMQDTSWCPTPGCQAVFTFDAALDNYKCPSCSKHYCLACKCEMHAGMNCKEYKQIMKLDQKDRQFMMLAKGAKFKQCPNCKFWVEKNEGCDHMTCRCKYEFCYVCGGKYGACKCNGHADPDDIDNNSEEERLSLGQRLVNIDEDGQLVFQRDSSQPRPLQRDYRPRSHSPIEREFGLGVPLPIPQPAQIPNIILPPSPPVLISSISSPSPSFNFSLPPSSRQIRFSPSRLPSRDSPKKQMEIPPFPPGIRPLQENKVQVEKKKERQLIIKRQVAEIETVEQEKKEKRLPLTERFERIRIDLASKFHRDREFVPLEKKQEQAKQQRKLDEPAQNLLKGQQNKIERKFPTVLQLKQKYNMSFSYPIREKKEQEK